MWHIEIAEPSGNYLVRDENGVCIHISLPGDKKEAYLIAAAPSLQLHAERIIKTSWPRLLDDPECDEVVVPLSVIEDLQAAVGRSNGAL